MKRLLFSFLALGCISSLAAEFERVAVEYNDISGIFHVRSSYPSSGLQYVIPLNDSVDNKLKKVKWGRCIKIKGSQNDGTLYARDIKDCN